MKSKIFTAICILFVAACNPSVQDLLKNGGFEASPPNGTFPDNGWLPSWHPRIAGSVTTTTAARTGNCGLWIYTSDGTSFSKPSQKLKCSPGKIYKGEAFLRSPQGEAWTQDSECFISLTFLSSSNTEIDFVRSESLKTGNTGWKSFTVTGKAPEGSVSVIFMINLLSEKGQSVCNADDCSLILQK